MALKKKYPWNVLVFPAASEIGLEIHRALRDSKEVILHGANQPGYSVTAFHFQRLYEIPPISDPACLNHLQRLITEHSIDAIFPAYDDILVWLAENAGHIAAKILAPDAAVCSICRSKRLTYEKFKGIIPVPKLWNSDLQSVVFPVFVKPDKGQGSQRARRIENAKSLDAALAAEPDLLVMEYLPGREYTIDCFSQKGRVLYAQARARMQTKNGISTITRAENIPAAREMAEKISNHLNLSGTWFFQIKENAAGQFCLLEIAPRIAGSMAHSRVSGPNFPLLSLYDAAGYELSIDSFEADMLMGRSLDVRFIYDRPIDALYVDLDDTLILRGQVNTKLAALIFQCRNRKIPVALITRHKADLNMTLEKFRLKQLFDRVIHIPDDTTPKANFITEKHAVLIDDSFQERHDAFTFKGVRCFDAAGALCLLDERA